MTALVITLIALVTLDILLRILRGRGRTELRDMPQRATPQQPDLVVLARPLLNTLDLKPYQLERLVSSQEFGRRFYDYVLDHPAVDDTVLELLAQAMPTSNLGKVLAHPRANQKAKDTAQGRLQEEAAREAASSSDTESSWSFYDGHECEVGGPSCCGRGQGPYYN